MSKIIGYAVFSEEYVHATEIIIKAYPLLVGRDGTATLTLDKYNAETKTINKFIGVLSE